MESIPGDRIAVEVFQSHGPLARVVPDGREKIAEGNSRRLRAAGTRQAYNTHIRCRNSRPATGPQDGKRGPLDYVVSENLQQRLLKQAQWAETAEMVANMKRSDGAGAVDRK